jgi:hypothetical protein|tara:strand:+ start:262 stop:1254 length:993 start_codon:yes stop_codon:yes gene_type:complete
MVKNIIGSIFITVIIAVTIFLIIMNIPQENQNQIIGEMNYKEIQENFFSKEFKINEKKIFIIGSSYTQALNTTKINLIIQKDCNVCQVYNLSIQADSIEKRSQVIDSIISANPKMIIYGISEEDFANNRNVEFNNSNPIFPDIKNLILNKIEFIKYFELLEIPTSPKDKTWSLIRQLNKDDSINQRFTPYPNTPFLKILEASTISISEIELRSLASNIPSSGKINDPENNKNFQILKEMINKIHEKNIKVILFMVPIHDYALTSQSKEFKKSFELIEEELVNSLKLDVNSRSVNYSNMPIWHDLFHIAVNNQSLIFSEDISNIILKELNK